MEGAADADAAFRPDASPHRLHYLSRQGESEPGSAMPLGERGVDLGELVEDLLQLLGRNPDAGVLDAEQQVPPLRWLGGRARAHRHLDAPLFRELDGVTEEVDQYLPEPSGVPLYLFGQIPLDPPGKVDAAFPGAQKDHLNRCLHHVGNGERFPLEFHYAGLQARKIEQVGDDAQQ